MKHFQIRNLPGDVTRAQIAGRQVDYWTPAQPPTHLIVAHDGHNIFDRKTATRRRTWQLAERADQIFRLHGLTPPLIIGVFHSGSKADPWGRAFDLAPQEPFQNGVAVAQGKYQEASVEEIRSDQYLKDIVEIIVPTVTASIGFNPQPQRSAMLGSSMGGLATLYALGKYPYIFHTGLAFSPHWVLGENALVDALIDKLPPPDVHKIWMSRGSKGLDADYTPFQDYANQKMTELGWSEGRNFHTQVFTGDRHNEPSWRRQLTPALNFWLKND